MEMDFGRDDIEKMLFKRASLDKKWMNILAGTFDERFFKTPYLGTLALLQVRYYTKYGTMANFQTLLSLMKGYAAKNPAKDIDLAQVTELVNDITSFDLHIPDEVANSNMKEFIRRNAFYNALYDNAGLLRDDESGYEKVVTKCLENFDRVQKLTFNDTDLGMDYFDAEAMKRHWEYISNPEAKIKTGWDYLDIYTHGGFLKEGRSLYLFMAQAGLGKSLFMSNLAVNFLKQGLSVVVISLEMSEDVYAQRFDAHISRHDINKLKENEASAVEEIKKFYKDHPTSNLYIKEYPPKSVTCNEIKSYLETLKANGHHFDVIIVDYLNIVKSSMKTDNMFIDGLDVSEKLRAISYDMKCPVISAIQTNREGMNNDKVGMENISQSSGIAFTADFLMSLFQTDVDRDHGQIRGRILKNRLGGMIGQTLTFDVDPHSLVIENRAPDDEGNNACDEVMTKKMKSADKMMNDINDSQKSLIDM